MSAGGMATEDGPRSATAPTETSPLLNSDTIKPNSAATSQDQHEANDAPDGNDGDTLEGQPKPYEGMPEVKARMKYIFPALTIGVFLSAADQTIIVSSYGAIGSDLHALNLTSWIATAYFLTLTSFQPLYGKLSDIFGRKVCLLFAYTIFGIGCLLCGLAQDMPQLIGARAFAGIGGGGMTTVVSILLSDVVPLRERGKWQGYINIIYAAGASTGAPLGGLLADSIGWRWAFLAQAPMCLVAFIAVSIALHLPQKDEVDWKKKLGRIDFLGAAILIAAVFTLLLALDRGSNDSWSSTITIVSISLSAPSFIIFVLVEVKVAREPFAPGHIIFNRSMVACYLCNFFAFSGWLAALFYVPLYFQAVDNLTATGAGLRLIPSILCGVSGSLFGGLYMQKTGKFYWITVIGYSMLTAGMTGIVLLSGVLTNSTIGIILCMCVNAFGNGIGVTTTLIGLIANSTHEDQAVATACSYLFRSLGSVFGVSMSATVANQALRKGLATELPSLGLSEDKALEIADKVRQSLAYLRELKPAVRSVVANCYAYSTNAAFMLQIGLVAGAAISAWFIREKSLSR